MTFEPVSPVPPVPPAPAQKNTVATVAMILGIVAGVTLIFNWIPFVSGVACLSPFVAIAAIVTGIIGLSTAKKTGGIGRGNAIIGLVIGILVFLLYVVLIGLALLILSQGLGGY